MGCLDLCIQDGKTMIWQRQGKDLFFLHFFR
jgi:hypothetical protein